MATRRKVSSRRTGSNRSRPVRRTARSRVAAAPRKRVSSRRRTTAKRASPRAVRIVLETAGQNPVREGDAVGIGQKVATSPRLKPRF